jgi:hypothetical protein
MAHYNNRTSFKSDEKTARRKLLDFLNEVHLQLEYFGTLEFTVVWNQTVMIELLHIIFFILAKYTFKFEIISITDKFCLIFYKKQPTN